jgi:hypothetical protein
MTLTPIHPILPEIGLKALLEDKRSVKYGPGLIF